MCNKFRSFLILLFLSGLSSFVYGGCDPFSKIVVKSKSAIFQKVGEQDGTVGQGLSGSSNFSLRYKDGVQVSFADSTTISSDSLELFVQVNGVPGLDSEKNKDAKRKSDVDKVVFVDNVVVTRENRKIFADRVEIIVSKKSCELSGHVKIEQIRDKSNSGIPIKTECERARFCWDSHDIELLGGLDKLVCTTIELGGNMRILSKKDTNGGAL